MSSKSDQSTGLQPPTELEAKYLAARVLQEPTADGLRRPSLDDYLSVIVRGSA